jgi:Zn-dependent protease/CBS domain-containing protein
MSWSWKLGRVAGIPIYVHWTFLILIAWVLGSSWSRNGDVQEGIRGAAFVLALFGCVVLHELGHALAARRYGIPTRDITLLPIGGVARLERMPEDPWQELIVALAGPAVNVIIAVILFPLIRLSAYDVDPDGVEMFLQNSFLGNLLVVNIFLCLFNLLPAFPMDGGRVLRALLAMKFPYARATRIAASVGQVMAILFGFLGLTSGNPMLLLIALFVWIGAEAEASQIEERAMLRGVPVADAMLTDFKTIDARATLGEAAQLLLAGSQHDFPVGDGPNLVGVLPRARLIQGLAEHGAGGLVSQVMEQGIGTVELREGLAGAVARLREGGEGPCLQVLDRGRPVGLLTLENISELLMIRSALAQRS